MRADGAIYKHVANKEELLDGMVEVIVGEIDPPAWAQTGRRDPATGSSRPRRALLRHRWACQVIESRTHAPPLVLDYMDSLIGMFRAGGFSVDLTHHVMHALGSRMWGFTRSSSTPPPTADPDVRAAMFDQLAAQYPYIIEIATAGFTRKDRPWVEAATTSSRSSSPGPPPGRVRATPPAGLELH